MAKSHFYIYHVYNGMPLPQLQATPTETSATRLAEKLAHENGLDVIDCAALPAKPKDAIYFVTVDQPPIITKPAMPSEKEVARGAAWARSLRA